MAIQMYLINLRAECAGNDDIRASLAGDIAGIGGFVLMATNTGALIAAFDECHLRRFQALPAVDFCGGITLDPNGAAANKIRQFFATNVARQLQGRCAPEAPGTAAPQAAPVFPPGYRPLPWARRFQ